MIKAIFGSVIAVLVVAMFALAAKRPVLFRRLARWLIFAKFLAVAVLMVVSFRLMFTETPNMAAAVDVALIAMMPLTGIFSLLALTFVAAAAERNEQEQNR
jgi:uncharacterized SAM-binding protein YcdF (DUF218 family)